jgi:dTDP-4-dehydrorhamnose 3,5-epimerase
VRFVETGLAGAYVIEIEPLTDERGFFARTFCAAEFAEHGLADVFVQCNLSGNPIQGTLRGMHLQAAPCAEDKLVRCTRGIIFDVMLDLRPESSTFKQWRGYELSAENHRAVYIPQGCAHGFVTLTPDVEVFYQMSREYQATAARGVRWNDPAFGIQWPVAAPQVSARDNDYPDFSA